jgi:hypothetical protein
MLGRIITLAALVATAYWYWSGPYQESQHPSYARKLEQNTENMRLCIRTAAYKAGATGEGSGNYEQQCAEKFNLYRRGDQWHSYDDTRPDD